MSSYLIKESKTMSLFKSRISRCLAFLAVCTVSASAADWPVWRYDASHSGVSPEDLSGTLHLQWTIERPATEPAWDNQKEQKTYGHPNWRVQQKVSYDIAYQPIVVGTTMLFGSPNNDRMTAVSTQTGAELWRFYAQGPIRLAPVVSEDKVFFGSDDGYLYCLDLADGSLIWKKFLAPNSRKVLGNDRLISAWPVRGAPVVSGDTVYAAAGLYSFEGIFLYALSTEDGSEFWTNSGDGNFFNAQPHSTAEGFGGIAPQGYLTIAGDNLLVPNGRTLPACYDRFTGKMKYFRHGNMSKGLGGYHVVAYEDTFVCRDYKFSLENGDKLDTASALYDEDRLQIKVGDRIFMGVKTMLETDTASESSFDVTTDDGSWTVTVEGRPAGLVAADGKLFVTTTAGKIYCYGTTEVADPPVITEEIAEVPASDEYTGKATIVLQAYSENSKGICIVTGLENGRLIEELVLQSDLTVVGFDSDAEKIATIREYLDSRGLYGRRAHVINEDFVSAKCPPYIAKLVAAEDEDYLQDATTNTIKEIFNILRPFGGSAVITATPSSQLEAALTTALMNVKASHYSVDDNVLTKVGPIPGTSNWTSQYHDAANTTFAPDSAIKLPMGVLWFGGSADNTNNKILPRHGHGQPPLVCDGRYYIQGRDVLRCVDAYTGRVLWEKDFPLVGQFGDYTNHEAGHMGVGDNVVLASDAVYVLANIPGVNQYARTCYKLDPNTGDELGAFTLPEGVFGEESNYGFGFVATEQDYLITTAASINFDSTDAEGYVPGMDAEGKVTYPRSDGCTGETTWHPVGPGGLFTYNGSTSERLVVMNRQTGDTIWTYPAKYGFFHLAIAAGDSLLFAVDRLPTDLNQSLSRRIIETGRSAGSDLSHTREAELLCFRLSDGELKWSKSNPADSIFGTYLAYSAEYGLLVECQRASRDYFEPHMSSTKMAVYEAATGEMKWRNLDNFYWGGPIMLRGDMIITQSGNNNGAINLLTGEPYQIENALTGEQTEVAGFKRYGCGVGIGSTNLITFRSGPAGFTDPNNFAGTGNWGGFKSGCTINLMPANGLVVAPEYTRTCGCSYPIQTSVAMVHMPETEYWTCNLMLGDVFEEEGGKIRKGGFNFGAIGDRYNEEDSTLYMEFPYQEPAASILDGDGNPIRKYDFFGYEVPVGITVEGDTSYYRHHSLLFEGDKNWVASSGVKGASKITIEMVKADEEGNVPESSSEEYKVYLCFAEPEEIAAGERIFNVAVNGNTVLSNYDIVAEAGGSRKTIVEEVEGVSIDDVLEVTLTSVTGEPVISGVAAVYAGPATAIKAPAKSSAKKAVDVSKLPSNTSEYKSFSAGAKAGVEAGVKNADNR